MTASHRNNLSASERGKVRKVCAAFASWLDRDGNEYAKGTLEAAVSVVSRLRDGGSTDLSENLTAGGGQVRTSRPAVVSAFREFAVPGAPSSELGRTSRGTIGAVGSLLAGLHASHWGTLTDPAKQIAATDMLRSLCAGITAYHRRKNLDVPIGSGVTATRLVEIILERAAERPAAGGKVAQHLVGAKLAVRFDGVHQIGQDMTSAADAPTGRSGDFQLDTSIFHVTLAPGDAVLDKCEANLAAGLHPVLLVPYERLDQARRNCEDRGLRDTVRVHALGEFVGANIDEIGNYRATEMRGAIVRVIDEYNRRMTEIEADPSLTITVPDWMRQ